MDAFDADVLIYAAASGHKLGEPVRRLFPGGPVAQGASLAGIGSVLLVPELLAKPMREHAHEEVAVLGALLGRLLLCPADLATAELAAALGTSYGLRTVDAIHLATAIGAGADRFITNNSKDFPKSIGEIDITYPLDLSAN